MSISKLEQETIINFNEEEQTADVYTYNGKLKRRLKELHKARPEEVTFVRSDGQADTYTIPKAWVKISAPKKRKISEEERERRKRAMESMNKNRF